MAGGIAEPVLDELQAERAKLDLRKIKAEHRRLDEDEAERARQARERKEAARQQAEAEALAREQARLEAEERQRREAAKAAHARQRREIIQRVKGRVMDWAWTKIPLMVTIPRETEARARAEIERELAGLPVEEIPESELVAIAEGVRDKCYRPMVEAHRRQEEEERQKRREAEAEERRGEAATTQLVAHGKRYAEDRLDAEGVQGFERLGITRRIGAALDREIEGTESTRDVEELVEGLLAPEIKQVRRQAEERQHQEAEQQRQLRELARQQRERQRERQERVEEARLTAGRQRLASRGESYALRLLNEENELEPLERFRVAREVKNKLLNELDGDESEEEVEDLVQEILDEELGEEG